MNYKSYLIEQNLNIINENVILFYGENIGLKNEFRQKIKTNKSKSCAIINLNQDEIYKIIIFYLTKLTIYHYLRKK